MIPIRSLAPWAILALTAAAVAFVVLYLDLTPRVEGDFFFASDDPQVRESAEIDERFPSSPQVLVSASAGEPRSKESLDRLRALGRELGEVPGVASVISAVSGPPSPADAFEGPFWSRLLAPGGEGGGDSTLLIAELAPDARPEAVVPAIEAVAAAHRAPELRLELSGVPFVVEVIRRQLARDLRVFTLAALAVFGLLVALLYRDLRLAAGILATCLASCAAALALLRLLGIGLGVLTANLVTIVFVLTLSHLVYLTANHRRLGEDAGAAVRATAEASFWCMATTLLGFASLLLASARPLRELGTAGSLGTAVAFAAAYSLYPAFLHWSADAHRAAEAAGAGEPGPIPAHQPVEPADPFSGRRLGRASAGVALLALVAAAGLFRVETDPGLLAYFDPDGEIGAGLAAIDARGGSSPLRVVFREPSGARLDTQEGFDRILALQSALEADPEVGTTLSLAPLLQEAARSSPYAGFLGVSNLVELLSTPAFRGVARSFLSEDRTEGVVLLRMREAGRSDPRRPERDEVVARVEEAVREAGLEPVAVGGLYELQGALSGLVASSLLVGLGGLAILFAGIAWAVSRSIAASAAMLVCLVGTPVFVFGVMGWAGLAVDFISSPAANVALGLGIDSMIHLATAARRLRGRGLSAAEAWSAARGRMWRPVAGAATLLAVGFGLFGLSSFPPTRRFGIAVVVGLSAATVLTLVVLPWLATRFGQLRRELGSRRT
jgi:uncharacterized protein